MTRGCDLAKVSLPAARTLGNEGRLTGRNPTVHESWSCNGLWQKDLWIIRARRYHTPPLSSYYVHEIKACPAKYGQARQPGIGRGPPGTGYCLRWSASPGLPLHRAPTQLILVGILTLAWVNLPSFPTGASLNVRPKSDRFGMTNNTVIVELL
jgi:hypothetical protein